MSSSFSRLPRYIGDTDDEHSIHLKHMIGKSNPLRSPRKAINLGRYQNSDSTTETDEQLHRQDGITRPQVEEEISMTLNGVQEDVDEKELNESYLKFINNQYDNDYVEEDDDDYVLSDDETYNETSDDEESEEWKYLDYKRGLSNGTSHIHVIESPRLKKSIDYKEQQDTSSLDKEISSIRKSTTMRSKTCLGFTIAYVTVLFVILIMMLNNKPLAVAGPEVDVAAINTRVDHLDLSLLQLQRQTESTLDRINSNIEDLIKSLPTADTEKLIYLKHGQVQLSPQFHQFLNLFLDSYSQSYINDKLKAIKQEKKLDNVDELKEYVDQTISQSIDSVAQKVEANVDKILDGLNIVNDTITTDPRQKSRSTSDKVWINSMLDFVSKGSKLVNYADYNQGSRILGFLTSDLDKHNLLQKMWYGWIIFAKGLQDHNNAIHVLLEDDISWQGGYEIGIRLSTSVIPTDILIQLENDDAKSPVHVSIGFKPYTRSGFDKLKFPKVEDSVGHNTKACKFKYIKSSQIQPGINHIKLPVRFVNYQIHGKDIYFKFSRNVRIGNIKVYGISDINAVQLQNKFKLLVDEFNVEDSVGVTESEQVSESKDASGADREEMKVYDINDDIYL